MERLPFEPDEEEQELEPEERYHTWEEANDRGYRQSDFV